MPAYQRIAADLRQRIHSGDLPPGSQLPTYPQLSNQWNVSEIVARQAIRTLVAEDLVITRQGAGTFVAEQRRLTRLVPHRYRRNRSFTTYQEEAANAGLTVELDHDTTQVVASPEVANRLAIEPGDAVSQTDYVVSMDGQPISTSRCWEPLDITGGTPIEHPDEGPYGHLGIVDRFAAIGHHVREVEEILTVQPATADQQRRLRIDSAARVITVAQAFTTIDRVVEVADITFRSDRYKFIYRMPIPTDIGQHPDDGSDLGFFSELM